MSVIFSKKCEHALQAILYLSTKESGSCVFASEISEELGIPKEFISKILQDLVKVGLIFSKKGKGGGFCLGRSPKEIRLIDIVYAIDGKEVFTNCVLGFRGCSVSEPCPVHNKWGKLRNETQEMLSNETLADLMVKTKLKLGNVIL